jgi:hypothetical protein
VPPVEPVEYVSAELELFGVLAHLDALTPTAGPLVVASNGSRVFCPSLRIHEADS